MGYSEVLLDTPVELVHVICPILRSILDTDHFYLFRCRLRRPETGTLQHSRLLKLDFTLAVMRLLHLHPRVLECLFLATHLPHHVVHVDIGFAALIFRHEL